MNFTPERAGLLDGSGRRFALIAARFNGRWVEDLVAGARDCLVRHGAREEDVVVVRVPGAWEIPQALEVLARQGGWHGLVALGVVLRGETTHFEYVAGECARGAADVARKHRVPVGFGVLTCERAEQVEARAGGKLGNKGWDAALATLEMAVLFRSLNQEHPLSQRP